MTSYVKRSRVTKALTDAGLAKSFADAEARLDRVHVCVVLGASQAGTPAGQAAALTALATARKCFGRVSLATQAGDAPLIPSFPIGPTVEDAATALGATVELDPPPGTTHLVRIGSPVRWSGWQVACWWDRWLAGTRAHVLDQPGDSRLALSGSFAGALAVRQVFADVLAGGSSSRDLTVSLWEPWAAAKSLGPDHFRAPDALWIVGLGHLGQAFVWTLLMLPYRGARRIVLQDDQRIDEENEATSLLVLPGCEVGNRKVRLANRWLEFGRWDTELIERRHRGDLRPTPDDPPFLLAGLDKLPPRKMLAGTGFDYMIDAGIGHGPGDFEGSQIRVIAKGTEIDRLWNAPTAESQLDRLLGGEAYQSLEREIGTCGTFSLASASVAVPFVGAATGALAIAQVIRLASMQPGSALLQMELGSPEMVIDSGLSPAPQAFLGGETISLDELSARIDPIS